MDNGKKWKANFSMGEPATEFLNGNRELKIHAGKTRRCHKGRLINGGITSVGVSHLKRLESRCLRHAQRRLKHLRDHKKNRCCHHTEKSDRERGSEKATLGSK